MLFMRWFWLGVVLANSVRFCDWGATLWCRNPLLSPNKFTRGHLMKTEWLVTDVTAAESPDIVERAILEVIMAGRCFAQFSAFLWSIGHFVFPWQRRTCYFGGDFGWALFCPVQAVFLVRESLCDVGDPSWALLSLVADATAVRSPELAERAILGVILAGRCFG